MILLSSWDTKTTANRKKRKAGLLHVFVVDVFASFEVSGLRIFAGCVGVCVGILAALRCGPCAEEEPSNFGQNVDGEGRNEEKL